MHSFHSYKNLMIFFLLFQRMKLREYKSCPRINRAQLEFNPISFKIQSLLWTCFSNSTEQSDKVGKEKYPLETRADFPILAHQEAVSLISSKVINSEEVFAKLKTP